MTILGHLKFLILLLLTIMLSYDPQLLPAHFRLLSLMHIHRCAANAMQILSLNMCSYTSLTSLLIPRAQPELYLLHEGPEPQSSRLQSFWSSWNSSSLVALNQG